MTIGIALELDQTTGDLVMETNDGGGKDFRLIEGQGELVQALQIRMRTLRGEDMLNPTVGLPMNEIIGLLDEDFLAAEVRATILQDGRIRSVEDIEVTMDRPLRVATVRARVVAKDGRTLTVLEAFGL